jgi:hypothetical protein
MSMWDEPEPELEQGLVNQDSGSGSEDGDSAAMPVPESAEGGEGSGAKAPGVDQNTLQCDPKNPILPRNPEKAGQGRFAFLVAFAGFGATVGALTFSRMVTLIGENGASGSLPREMQDQYLLAASAGLFAVSLLCVFGVGKTEHAMPVLNDLTFERMRSSWLGVVSTSALYLFILFFVSGLTPVKLGSGSLCRETFFAEPEIAAVGEIGASITFRSSAPSLMTMLLLLFYARFILVSLCNSAWHGWQKFTWIVYLIALLTCGLSAYRLFDDLKYCTLASSMPPQCGLIVDSQSFEWYQLQDAGAGTQSGDACTAADCCEATPTPTHPSSRRCTNANADDDVTYPNACKAAHASVVSLWDPHT